MSSTKSLARGLCAACGTFQSVKADGHLRAHWEPGTSHRCIGSGWEPAKDKEPR